MYITKIKMIILIALPLALTLIFTGCGKTTVKLTDYVDYNVQGIDGYGTIHINHRLMSLDNMLAEKLKLDPTERYQLSLYIYDIDFNIDKPKNLKNGDEVIISPIFNKAMEEKYKVKFDDSVLNVKVEGLKEGLVINPFQDVEILFSGISPYIKAELANNSTNEMLRSIRFQYDNRTPLKLGDQLLVTALVDEFIWIEQGYIPEKLSMLYIVENADKYVTKPEEIYSETQSKMLQHTKDIIDAYMVKSASSFYREIEGMYDYRIQNISYKMEPHDGYLLTVKEGFTPTNRNQTVIFMIYRINIDDNRFKNREAFMCVQYFNPILRKEGYTDLNYSSAKLSQRSVNFDDIYRNEVVSLRDRYDVIQVDVKEWPKD